MNARLFILLGCFVAQMMRLHAVAIYSTYGPDPYTPAGPTHIFDWDYDFSAGAGTSIGAPFSFSGSSYRIDSITLDISRNIENAPNIEIGIYGEDNNHPSLTPIALLQPDPTFTSAQRQSITYNFSENAILQADVHYWLVLQPKIYAVADSSYNGDYSISSSSVASGFAVRSFIYPDNTTWGNWTLFNGPAPVFRLDGTAVPEPGTWALLTLGSALFYFAARRRRIITVHATVGGAKPSR